MEQIKLIFNCNCQHATDTLAGSMVSLMFYTFRKCVDVSKSLRGLIIIIIIIIIISEEPVLLHQELLFEPLKKILANSQMI